MSRRLRHRVRRACWAAIVVASAWPGAARAEDATPSLGAAAAEPCRGTVSQDVLRAVGPDGEASLASGQVVKLVDIRLPDAARATPVLRSFAESAVAVTAIGPADRWGRQPGRLALSGRGEPIDLAELLVGEGLALVDPGERDGLCRRDLLALEAAARTARRGLWRDEAVLAAAEPEALRARADRFAIVEGRIRSVGERRERTYLNFGRDFGRDFAVSIPRRSWQAFKSAGRDAAALRGRLVRVRGTIEVRRAPGMEIVTPDVLEYVDERPPPQ